MPVFQSANTVPHDTPHPLRAMLATTDTKPCSKSGAVSHWHLSVDGSTDTAGPFSLCAQKAERNACVHTTCANQANICVLHAPDLTLDICAGCCVMMPTKPLGAMYGVHIPDEESC